MIIFKRLVTSDYIVVAKKSPWLHGYILCYFLNVPGVSCKRSESANQSCKNIVHKLHSDVCIIFIFNIHVCWYHW